MNREVKAFICTRGHQRSVFVQVHGEGPKTCVECGNPIERIEDFLARMEERADNPLEAKAEALGFRNQLIVEISSYTDSVLDGTDCFTNRCVLADRILALIRPAPSANTEGLRALLKRARKALNPEDFGDKWTAEVHWLLPAIDSALRASPSAPSEGVRDDSARRHRIADTLHRLGCPIDSSNSDYAVNAMISAMREAKPSWKCMQCGADVTASEVVDWAGDKWH